MLAHKVDRGGRVTHAAQQAGGAAHNLDAIVNRHVGDGFAPVAAQRPCGRHAVDLGVLDLEAARVEGVADVIGFLDDHADAVLDHVLHADEVLVEDALRRHDADRLGRLANGEAKAGGSVDLVGDRVFAADDDARFVLAGWRVLFGKRWRGGCRRIGGLRPDRHRTCHERHAQAELEFGCQCRSPLFVISIDAAIERR